MTFFVNILGDYLWHQYGIAPESVRLDTCFRHDLHLTDQDMKAIIRHLTHRMGITCPVDTVQQLTDVADLLMYIVLRSLEEEDLTNYFGEPAWPLAGLPGKDALIVRVILTQRSNPN